MSCVSCPSVLRNIFPLSARACHIKSLLTVAAAVVTGTLMTACETTGPSHSFSSAPVTGVDMGRGSRVAIVAEQGGDVQPLVQKLYELFAARGYYQMVDRSNLQQTMQERQLQRMSFVNGDSPGAITGADLLIHVQADARSNQIAPQDLLGSVLAPHAYDTAVNYTAGFRAIRVGSGEVVAARMIELADQKGNSSISAFSSGVDPAPMVSSLRDQAAAQIFQSLHP